MDKRIAYKIALCQIASDAGKDIVCPELIRKVGRSAAYKAIKGGYKMKNQLIKELCHDIAANRKCGFRFWWEKKDYDHSIVYFECTVKGEKVQVSFHNPGNTYQKWIEQSKGFKTSWDKKDCRESCIKIINAANVA